MTERATPLPARKGLAVAVEIAFHVGLVLLAAGFIWQATLVNQPPTKLQVGPRTFPLIVGGMMLVVALVLLARCLRAAFGATGSDDADDAAAVPLEEDDDASVADWTAVWIVLGSLLALFILLEPLGFVVAMSLFLFGLPTVFSPAHWRRNLVVAVVFSVFFFFLFSAGLGIPLPRGILAPLLPTMVG